MKYLCLFILVFLTQLCQAGSLTVLTYHDIIPDTENDAYAVSRSEFVAQMDYLVKHGYEPVSLAYLDKVKSGEASLPVRPVLLTFDDGLKSYYEFVVPLLSIYRFPSIASVVTSWLDGVNIPVEYQGRLMNWKQLQSLADNNLVEIASHTDNLHYGIRSNPQGNEAAASITRLYDPQTQEYESEALFLQRINQDLKRSARKLQQHLGYQPNAITWPYGHYNSTITRLASAAGFDYQFTLAEGPSKFSQLPLINRILMFADTSIHQFEKDLNYEYGYDKNIRFVEVQLDAFLNKNTFEQEQLLSNMLDSLQQLDANMVIVSPFTSDMSKAFFTNDEYELAHDILNRCLHQIKEKLAVRHIYLKMPGDPDLVDADAFYFQLARLNWFNGIAFTENPERQNLKLIKSIMERHLPDMKYGHYAAPGEIQSSRVNAKNDFVILEISGDNFEKLKTEKLSSIIDKKSNTFVFLSTIDNNTQAEDISQAFSSLRNLGILHYGFGPLQYSSDISNNALQGENISLFGSGSGG